MEKEKKGVSGGLILAAASVAAVAGAYFIFGKPDAKTKKQIKSWTLKAKADVLAKIEGMKEVSQEKYEEVVDAIETKYAQLKNVDPNELHAMATDMKKHWAAIQKSLSAPVKKAPKNK